MWSYSALLWNTSQIKRKKGTCTKCIVTHSIWEKDHHFIIQLPTSSVSWFPLFFMFSFTTFHTFFKLYHMLCTLFSWKTYYWKLSGICAVLIDDTILCLTYKYIATDLVSMGSANFGYLAYLKNQLFHMPECGFNFLTVDNSIFKQDNE